MQELRRVIRRLIRLTPAEWTDLVSAQLALIGAQVRVWRRPVGHLLDGVAAGVPSVRPLTPDSRAKNVALAVSRAAEYGIFRPRCLVRALALHRMLEERRLIGSQVRIGVRRSADTFAAHAWVEYAGDVLGDRVEHVREFSELADVELVRGR